MLVTLVVLAAGSSRRLGRPKQTLPLRGSTLLGTTLDALRAAPADQRIVTLGAASTEVRERVDLTGYEVVEVVDHGQGCSASIVAAVDRVDPSADGFVLLLGDQPDVRPDDVAALTAFVHRRSEAPDAVITRYDDGPGHPMWLARRCFADLRLLHGDKGVWRLLESGTIDVQELPLPGRTVPLDVDTWDDYLALGGVGDTEPAP